MIDANPDTTTEVDTATADAAEIPAEATEPAESTDATDTTDADDSDADSHPGRREARYRTQLRQAEAERDDLRAQVQNLQRAQVDAVIETHGVRPKAVWAAGVELASLLGSDGLPDRAAVKAAVTATRSEFGIGTGSKARPDASGLKSGAGIPQAAPKGWLSAFAPPRD